MARLGRSQIPRSALVGMSPAVAYTGTTTVSAGATFVSTGRKGAQAAISASGAAQQTTSGLAGRQAATQVTASSQLATAARKGALVAAGVSGGMTLTTAAVKGARGASANSNAARLVPTVLSARSVATQVSTPVQVVVVGRKGAATAIVGTTAVVLATSGSKGASSPSATSSSGRLTTTASSSRSGSTQVSSLAQYASIAQKGALGASSASGSGRLTVSSSMGRVGVSQLSASTRSASSGQKGALGAAVSSGSGREVALASSGRSGTTRISGTVQVQIGAAPQAAFATTTYSAGSLTSARGAKTALAALSLGAVASVVSQAAKSARSTVAYGTIAATGAVGTRGSSSSASTSASATTRALGTHAGVVATVISEAASLQQRTVRASWGQALFSGSFELTSTSRTSLSMRPTYVNVIHYVGDPSVAQETRRRRLQVMQSMRRMGVPVLLKRMLTIEDVDDGFAMESPNQSNIYRQGRNIDPLSWGTGYCSIATSIGEWMTTDGRLVISPTNPGDGASPAPLYRGFGPGYLTYAVLPDAPEDVLKYTVGGALVRTQQAVVQLPWWPKVGDNDLLVVCQIDQNETIVATGTRYQLKQVQPMTLHGMNRRGRREYLGPDLLTGGDSYLIGQQAAMSIVPENNVIYQVECDR